MLGGLGSSLTGFAAQGLSNAFGLGGNTTNNNSVHNSINMSVQPGSEQLAADNLQTKLTDLINNK